MDDAFPRSQHGSSANRPPSLVSIASTSSDYSISLPPAFLPAAAFSLAAVSTGFPFPESSLSPDRSSRAVDDETVPPPTLNPRHALMRLRRVSMPANVSQSNHHASPSYSGKGKNRMSVASLTSVGSFESLPEEDAPASSERQRSNEGVIGVTERPPLASINTSGNRPKPLLAHRATTPAKGNVRRIPISRTTLPAPIPHGATYLPFVIPKSTFGPRSPLSRPTSIGNSILREDELREEMIGQRLGGEGKRERVRTKSTAGGTEEETMRREDRRWRIALELRDTERAYLGVLEEIDSYYYQPLLAALPPSPFPSRRASRNSSPSSPVISPLSPPASPMLGPLKRMSTYIPSSPLSYPVDLPSAQILSRKEVTEIFSNFPDVLNLAMVMSSSLDTAVPDRPSDPVPVSPVITTAQLFPPSSFNTSPELSSSSDTLESDGPPTPGDSKRKKSSEDDPTNDYSPRPRGITAPPLSLGKMLIPILPFLKSYSFFISNFASALSRLASLESISAPPSPSASSSLESRSKWQGFTEERRRLGVGRGLGLGALLLNIVQRIPRYRLLLADLCKYTEPDHVDFRELQTAFQVVDNVANFLEIEIQAHVNVLRILELQRSLIGLDAPLLIPGRRFIRSSALRKLDRRGNSQNRTFYLFNDILLYAAEAEAGWGIGRGLGFADVVDAKAPPKQHRSGGGGGSGSWDGLAGGSTAGAVQMRMIRRLGLYDVTVVGAEDCGVPGKRHGFEILTSEKSFAVYTDSREEKESWIEAIRDAKSDLLRDRRTLLKDGESTMRRTHRERQTSMLIAPGALRPAFATPPPNPRFDFIPPTPSDEIDALVLNLPPAIVPVSFVPPELPPSPTRPSLRTRRWSDMTPEAAAQAIAEVPPSPVEVAVEVRVIENYNAPLWIPDNKVSRCMRCTGHFGVWRRRHHCRLCGAVVCWSCSTKSFVIPSDEVGTPNRLARSCDECYETVFSPADVGLVVESPTVDNTASLLVESASRTSAPDFYLDSLDSPATIKEATSRGRLRDSLASLLGRRT